MKRLFFMIILLSVTLSFALSSVENSANRGMDLKQVNNGQFKFNLSNYGTIEDLVYLPHSKLIFKSGTWISGKKVRRDEFGRLLYWRHYPPHDEYDYLSEDHEEWNSSLPAVIDTLTSVAYDGDLEIMEQLPAYNPLASSVPNFDYYSQNDIVLESNYGIPSPLPFDPFNSETFCFTIPQEISFDTPGCLTHSAYSYDYCPFGTPGDRDYGASAGSSTHHPLGVAIHQETYSWPVQNHYYLLAQKCTIYNTNQQDSIEDLALSYYFDADVGPESWGSGVASDDKSGYVKGPGYEFAYSYDADMDHGLSPMYIGCKTRIPDFEGSRHAWYWSVGSGPDDSNVYDVYPSNLTANEKYWLATGKNPRTNYSFVAIRKEDPNITQWEQSSPNDTRVLYTLFGAQPGTPEYDETDLEGNYFRRFKLAPHESITFYVFYFVGSSVEDLMEKSLQIEEFIANDLYIDPNMIYTAIPYLSTPQNQAPDTFVLNWNIFSNPDHFELAWKEYGLPASQWNIIELPADARSYNLTEMDPLTYYEVKVGAVFYTPQEVYLESETKMVNLTYIDVDDDVATPAAKISNYPNPFHQSTRIEFELKESSPVKATIYNIKGQQVRQLLDGILTAGRQPLIWDAKDSSGTACSSGIYYLKLETGTNISTHKMLLIK